MASRSRRAVLSLTTRFCLPHEGMTSLEYLSSGSAVLVQPSAGSPPAVVTCQHVACPWLFPKYFTSTWDWLQFVGEDFVRHSLQLLAVEQQEDPTQSVPQRPQVLLDLPLRPQVNIHESRDLALLTLDNTDAHEWTQMMSTVGLEPLALQTDPSGQGAEVDFSGHKQFTDGGEEGFQTPKMVHGHFVGSNRSGQAFAWSQELLEEGMCGGAVVGASGECVGMVEGIVPPLANDDVEPATHDREPHAAWQMRQALAGHVAFIPSADMRAFIDQPGDLLLTGMELPPHM